MTTIHVDLIGGQETIDKLRGRSERIGNARPAFEKIERVLEEGEKRVFAGGKYVRTGDLKAALTQPGAEYAIREAHDDGQGLTFGAALWYAHFLKKDGKSAVLKLQPKERKAVSQIVLDWIVNGVPA